VVGPGFGRWLRYCEAAWPAVREQILAARADSDKAVAAFFHGGAGHSELPERCGYLAGLKVLRELNRAYRLDELIT